VTVPGVFPRYGEETCAVLEGDFVVQIGPSARAISSRFLTGRIAA
jgi:hypothetical protein